MASTINASTASGGGIISTADASGQLDLQSAGTTVASVLPAGYVQVGLGSAIGGTTNPLIASNGSANSYVQTYVHNDSTGISASADLACYPNNGTDASGWIDMGVTGSNYADTSYLITGANEGYIFMSAPSGASKSGNLVYATDSTGTENSHQWYVGGFNAAKAGWKMQLTSTGFVMSGGTATYAPLKLTAGTNLTTATAGAIEYDTTNTLAYFTGNTTNGRGLIPNVQYFRLAANGAATTTTIAPFFSTNSSIPLVANGVYEIEFYCYFLKNTAGTLVWTLTNSAVVTNMVADLIMSPITGFTSTPTGAPLTAAVVTQTAAAVAFAATGSLTTAVNHFAKFKVILENASSTSIRLNVTNSAGTITPLRGSFWKATRIANVGTYAA